MSEQATTPRVAQLAGRVAGWSVLLALVALLAAFFAVPRATGADTFTVLSGSMRPVLDPGDLIVVRATDPDEVGIGSVVTFQMESGDPAVATHRVVSQGVDDNGNPVFLTRGDDNKAADPVWIREEQVRGTVWYSVPYVGYVAQALPADLRQLLAVVAAAGLFVYAFVMLAMGIRDRRGASHA